jgi:membrane-associated phospholipid phosphatase
MQVILRRAPILKGEIPMIRLLTLMRARLEPGTTVPPLFLLVLALALLLPGSIPARAESHLIEPGAGAGHTWLLSSGSQLRSAPPPNQRATLAEIQQLKALEAQRDAAARDSIAFWTTGGPIYRWNELAIQQALKNGMNSNMAGRVLALIHVAISDATIATWDTKYAYNRPRPSQVDPTLTTVLPNPASPSYPSEHAAVATAAAAVLAYLFPQDAALFSAQAAAAGQAQLLAGNHYPSDIVAGQHIGRAVAALAIERAKNDGSDVQWTGSVPTEPGRWTGVNPVLPLAGTWQTWVLTTGSEVRPGPPPAYDSVQMAGELAEVTNFQRTPKTNADARFWEYGAGGARNYWFWNDQTTRQIAVYGLGANPPQTARVYALTSVAYYDAMVACWDAKYTYWAIRPFQLDPTFTPLFPTPNHPSYPSAHSCLSRSASTMLGWLFPHEAAQLTALADQAGESRIWAGLHFRSDIVVGDVIGRTVAWKVVERTQTAHGATNRGP